MLKPIIVIALFTSSIVGAQIESDLPKGLMLNLDFEQVKDGLIPSKTLYPLFVPLGGLGIEHFNSRNMLAFQYGEGLDIPHSSLLDPNGSEWVVSVRAFPLTDGIILSQGNDQHGYIIYMQDGHIRAAVRTGHSSFILEERADRGLTKYTKRWVTIELRLSQGTSSLNLNRKRVAQVLDQPALTGDNMILRLGHHHQIPSPHKNKAIPTNGFTGAINSFKVLRQ